MRNYQKYRNAWRYDGPPHEEPQLSDEEARKLLKHGGLLVRNTYDFDCQEETKFWHIIKDQYGDMEELSSRTRNKIRRAFSHFEYRIINYKQLTDRVFPILEDTFVHYKVHDRKMNRQIFSTYLNEHCQKRNFDYWGIFSKETQEMVGFGTVNCWDECCEYGYTGVFSDYLKNGYYPYYGLFHSMNRYYLQEKGFRYVTDGSRSITEHSNIQPFLEEKFHFRKAYCHLAVHYNWWMRVAVKILYPFRNIITFPSVKAVLFMEELTKKARTQ